MISLQNLFMGRCHESQKARGSQKLDLEVYESVRFWQLLNSQRVTFPDQFYPCITIVGPSKPTYQFSRNFPKLFLIQKRHECSLLMGNPPMHYLNFSHCGPRTLPRRSIQVFFLKSWGHATPTCLRRPQMGLPASYD